MVRSSRRASVIAFIGCLSIAWGCVFAITFVADVPMVCSFAIGTIAGWSAATVWGLAGGLDPWL